jgi:hypothetical protein
MLPNIDDAAKGRGLHGTRHDYTLLKRHDWQHQPFLLYRGVVGWIIIRESNEFVAAFKTQLLKPLKPIFQLHQN